MSSIVIPKLIKSDKGKWVEYEDAVGKKEKGRIKSWNQSWIFVVYKCDDNWDEYENYTGCATSSTQLRFI